MYQTHHSRIRSQGYILVLALVFLGIFFTASAAYLNSSMSFTRSARYDVTNAQALAIAEGALDVAVYQLNLDSSYGGQANTPLGSGVFTVTVSNINSVTRRVTATGYVPNSASPVATKTIQTIISTNNDVISFHFGIQSGDGGFTLDNTSSISGNVYSSGPIIVSNQNYIYGDVISTGASGLVYGIHATSSAYAHTIGNASRSTVIDKNAYYATTRVNTTVGGT